jgi:hypothetical protein
LCQLLLLLLLLLQGCHWRSCPDFELVACQYDPPGNWMNPGEFEKNVSITNTAALLYPIRLNTM